MRRQTLAVIAFLPLCACVSIQAPVIAPGTTKLVSARNYELGQTITAAVGDTLVRSKSYSETVTRQSAYRADQDFSVDGGIVHLTVRAGQELPVAGTRLIDGVRYDMASVGDVALLVGPDGALYPRLMGGLAPGMIPVQVIYAMRFTPASASLKPIESKAISTAPGDENYELLFNGIDGQSIRLQYREYTAQDLARPAFSQDLSYPITVKTIRFRRLVIELDRVTDQEMVYRVTADGRPL